MLYPGLDGRVDRNLLKLDTLRRYSWIGVAAVEADQEHPVTALVGRLQGFGLEEVAKPGAGPEFCVSFESLGRSAHQDEVCGLNSASEQLLHYPATDLTGGS